MTMTLAHLAKIETQVLRKGIIMTLLRYSSMMEVIPWEAVSSLSSVAVRTRILPTVAFRKINEGYTPNEGDLEQVWESVYGFGGEIKFDRVFEKIKNTIVDPKVTQTELKLKAMALTFNDYFINGDHAVDEDGFEGLKKRVANMPSRQTVWAAASNAAALDVTASTANAKTFFDKLEEAHYKCNRGQVNAIFLNEAMYYGIGRAARYAQLASGGWLDVTKDSFDRTITTWKGAPLIDVGLKRDQSTEIITDSETAGDSGSDATSIYMASFDMTEGLTGIQLGDMEVYDPLAGGEAESTPTKLLRIDWWCGLASFGNYGITRLRNVEGASNW